MGAHRELSELNANDIADAVRAGQLRAVEVLDHHLARIDKHAELGAFVFVDRDRAIRVAADVDERVAKGNDPGPLAGVPLGIKVTESVDGWPDRTACTPFADSIADHDATQVGRLLAAGAVPVGLTASPPMGLLAYTASALYGVCRNPWDPARTPGGSSGGSAAALAAGLVPLATGSDMGGSIRNPASFCGVVGIKGTYGRVPRGPGILGTANLIHLGPLARSVADLARYLDVAAGPSESDPGSLTTEVPSYEQALSRTLDGLRVAWLESIGAAVAEPAVAAVAHDAALALIASGGLDVRPVVPKLPTPDDGGTALTAALASSDSGLDPDMAARLPEILMDLLNTPGAQQVVELLAATGIPTPEQKVEAQQYRVDINTALADAFDEVDVLLTPTMPFLPFPAEGPMPTVVAGKDLGPGAVGGFTMPFNISGHPAVSVPAGLLDGTPVGLQIVCRRHEDHLALALAARLEAARPWARLAPGY